MKQYCMLICLLVSITTQITYAQANAITLRLNNVPITEVIKAIKKQTNYTFSYDVELETPLKETKVTLNVIQQSINQILPVLFDTIEIAYKVVDDNILLSKKKIRRRIRRKVIFANRYRGFQAMRAIITQKLI